MNVNSEALRALDGRADLSIFGDNRLLLFTLELGLGLEDVQTVASVALTDGRDDKKCDLVYVDRDSGKAIIAQGYMSQKLNRKSAPANKASGLNTAVSWLFGDPSQSIPPGLQSAATELRAAVDDGSVQNIELWYTHNLPESKSVQVELERAADTTRSLIRSYHPNSQVESVTATEVGRSLLDRWYKSSLIPILVSDEFSIYISGGFEERGDNWQAYCTSVAASWLHEIYSQHTTRLFSANVRNYLGSQKRATNINHNIKETAKRGPGYFWAYNNGLTALVNDYRVSVQPDGSKLLTIKGISIVNGAQTTGAIGSVDNGSGRALSVARVLARFVKCSNRDTVREIIKYNNTQNQIEATDFRSNDAIQERLRKEFQRIPETDYRGGRRGSEADIIKRSPYLIPSSTAAQALAAFHQQPSIAYNEKSKIWTSDEFYSRFFSDATTARHMLFAYSLLRTIEEAKRNLLTIDESERTDSQKDQVEFFRKRGSTFLLAAAIANCLEIYLGRAVTNTFALQFRRNVSPTEGIQLWRPLVTGALPFVRELSSAGERGLQSRSEVTSALMRFRSLVEATEAINRAIFSSFAQEVTVASERGARSESLTKPAGE